MSSTKNVLICGCFDMFHVGHLTLIEGASRFGNVYIGIGDDESIRDKKGDTRPIIPQKERQEILLGCRYVFEVKIFHFKSDAEKAYTDLLAWSKASVYACGPDHQQPVLFPLLEKRGIPILYIPNKIQGTTQIASRISETGVEVDKNRFYFPQ